MRVAIVGECLQGIEAAYPCSKAAYATLLVDRDANVPAKGLVDEFHALDVVRNVEEAKDVLRDCDAVLPAIENREAITFVQKLCDQMNTPFMHDNGAFWITSDKTKPMDFFLGWGSLGVATMAEACANY